MKLYSYSIDRGISSEPRWLTVPFVVLSIAAGMIAFLIVSVFVPWPLVFHPYDTELLKDENALLEIHLLQAMRRSDVQHTQLLRLQDRDAALNTLFQDRAEFGDSLITGIISFSAIQQHEFVSVNYFHPVKKQLSDTIKQ